MLPLRARRERGTRNGRDDADDVLGAHARHLLVEMLDVVIVHIHIDEIPELAVIAKEMFLELGVRLTELAKKLPNRRAFQLHGILVAGECAQRSRDLNLCRGIYSPIGGSGNVRRAVRLTPSALRGARQANL